MTLQSNRYAVIHTITMLYIAPSASYPARFVVTLAGEFSLRAYG